MSWIRLRPAIAGRAVSAARITTMAIAASHEPWREAVIWKLCEGLVMVASVERTREQAARPHDQDGEEGEMAGEDLPFRIDPGADGLRDPEHDAAGERTPEAAEPADDHRLERIEQPGRADGRIEI